jgi:TonB family protein
MAITSQYLFACDHPTRKYWLWRTGVLIVHPSSKAAHNHQFNSQMNRAISGILVVLAAVLLLPSVARAQDPRTTTGAVDAEQTFFDFQVEQAVRVKAARTPVYPDRLRSSHVEGQVLVQFVVDERGLAQMNTFKVLKSTDNELTASVMRAVSSSSFYPAEIQGKKVKQLVQQPYKFNAAR